MENTMQAEAVAQPSWDELRRERRFYVGVDLGQVSDFTAICVLERYQQPLREVGDDGNQKVETRYEIRHLERPALNTSYPAIVVKVSALMRSPALIQWVRVKGHDGIRVPKCIKPWLIVDGTGPGRPVVDEFRKAGLAPIGVTITAGDNVTRDGIYWRVPKRNLISQLQIVFQNRVLRIAVTLPLAEVLATELQNFTGKIDLKTMHDSYDTWRTSQHDDLLLAASLSLWWAQEQQRHGTVASKLLGF
jgi:hypothetical protein